MVKPPKRMEPESVELAKAGRASRSNRAFQADSFANYMARKIDGQRRDRGLVVPPDPRQQVKNPSNTAAAGANTKPSTSSKEVRFARDVVIREGTMAASSQRKRKEPFGMTDVMKRLKEHHGHGFSERQNRDEGVPEALASSLKSSEAHVTASEFADKNDKLTSDDAGPQTQSGTQVLTKLKPENRPDLFLFGVVVLVNGYTNPDAETLHRMLHKHGGDLEKYETSRVTHIIAESLSTAKANIYKRSKRPRPVCKPSWIVDSVNAQKLLPYELYLLEHVRSEESISRSLTKFFEIKRNLPTSSCAVLDFGCGNERELDRPSSNVAPISKGDDVALGTSPATQCHRADPKLPPSSVTQRQPLAPSPSGSKAGLTDEKYINGRIRTIGTDPRFLESFFQSSRLSFIGSFKQRVKDSPTKKSNKDNNDKRRFVMHVDMDCFFCAVVLRNFPQYKNKPVVISHHGMRPSESIPAETNISNESTSECATCNYEARKYGIRKGMYLGQAKQLCKDLVVLPYDFEGFEEVSEQVADILHRYAAEHNGAVEQVSCDEAYLELFLGDGSPESVEAIGHAIRRDIFDETQCTATIGIGTNKFAAKLATDKVKPDGLLYVNDYRELLRGLALRDIHGIGYRLEQRLSAEGFESVDDVWSSSKDELVRILGKGLGSRIYDLCYGKDDRPVEPVERKSIGAECNYGVRFNGPYGPDHAIKCLAREVGKRMSMVGVKGSKITLKVKQRKEGAPPPPKFLGHGLCNNLSKSRDTPSAKPTRDYEVISDICHRMYAELAVKKEEVRGIGVIVAKLTRDDSSQDVGKRATATSIKKFLVDCKTDVADVSIKNVTECSASMVTAHEVSGSSRFEVDRGDASAIINADVRVDGSPVFDIELPNLSQIHMSQVEQLPSPMKRQVMAQINVTKNRLKPMPATQKAHHSDVSDSRLKQTNVKRLFTLAAVKVGDAPLHGVAGESVSLRDFECLPLEMQLQLANNDTCGIGIATKPRRNTKASTGTHSHAKLPAIDTTGNTPPRQKDPSDLTEEDQHEQIPLFTTVDRKSFYENDLVPLHAFLDENPPNDGSITTVLGFFTACISENRLYDVSIMLRSIRNRRDSWSGAVFLHLMDRTDDVVFDKHKRRLDKGWIVV